MIEILRSIGQGEVGLDIVAVQSMTAALVFGKTLAAAVVAVMCSGGTFLESFAEGRARREMHDLLSRVPRTATRHRNGGLEDVPLDKTGTLTHGRPQIVSIDSHAGMGEDEILSLAASLDQASKHPVAQAIVAVAKARGLTLPVPTEVAEIPGEKVVGSIEGLPRQVLLHRAGCWPR
ncbi:MAG: hypothetical protein VR78_14645 [Hoeflea sp. BRH_c9]|nr:MAG: hypothetical protein VR78_14645 [Hoeflea sp. BRH_c9]